MGLRLILEDPCSVLFDVESGLVESVIVLQLVICGTKVSVCMTRLSLRLERIIILLCMNPYLSFRFLSLLAMSVQASKFCSYRKRGFSAGKS